MPQKDWAKDRVKIPDCAQSESLYHYTMAEGVHGIVKHREFIATKSDFLNDKLEFLYVEEVLRLTCERYISNDALREQFLSCVNEKIERFFVSDEEEEALMSFYVVAFSTQPNSALLWAEFTDFQGYCLEFDHDALEEGFQDSSFLHGRVMYQQEEQIACMLEAMILSIRKKVGEGLTDLEAFFDDSPKIDQQSLEELSEEIAVISAIYGMFFKKECFEGEEEYRYIFSPCSRTEDPEDIMEFRIKDQIFLPYIVVPFGDGDAPVPLKSVMIGAKNNSDIAERGIRYFLRREGLDVPVTVSDIPLRY